MDIKTLEDLLAQGSLLTSIQLFKLAFMKREICMDLVSNDHSTHFITNSDVITRDEKMEYLWKKIPINPDFYSTGKVFC